MAFQQDDRALSGVVGFILLFALLIVLLALYQTQIVPPQNAETEYQHSQTVQGDMLQVRNALLTADNLGQTQFAEVKLGTHYQPRTFAINPPAPAGTLATSAPQPITILDGTGTPVSNVCPTGTPIETRSLRYTPSYAEYESAPSIVYENTVLYLEFGNQTIPLTGQQLVSNDGNVVELLPLNTSLQITSTRTINIAAIPGQQNSVDVTDATITTPTGLSEATWEELLAAQLPPSAVTVANGNLTIQTSGTVHVGCSPVGLNNAPPGGERAAAGLEINPIGNIQIRDFNRPSNDVVEVTFNNTASKDINITEARLTFYNNPDDTGGTIGPVELIDPATGSTAASLSLLGDYQTLSPKVTLPGNGTQTTLTFRNTGGEKLASRDFFVVDLVFSTGDRGTYFVDVPA